MKRLVTALVLTALLLAGGDRWAGAHAVALFGHVSVDARGELVVRLVDVYGGLVEGQFLNAYATAPGGRPTQPLELAEGPPGTYRGVVTVPGAERYQVTIDMTLAGDLHRITYDVTAGQAQPERMVVMEAIDPPEGFPWSRLLYIGAAGLLVAATAVALLKKPPTAEEE